MIRILLISFILTTLDSCYSPAVITEPESVPMISHEEVMKIDFPTKKSVFLRFGTPTSKESFENIENWYYKISVETNSSGYTLSNGFGIIAQNPMNPYLNAINRSLVVQQTQNSIQNTKSTSVETYVKFWFVNDTVIKWQTYGVDFSRPKGDEIEVEQLKYANEYLYFDTLNVLKIYSHNSVLRNSKSGINGPMTLEEVNNWLDNHLDFKYTFLPTIDDLMKIYHSNSELAKILKSQGLVVWSESKGGSGFLKCFDFKLGIVIEKNHSTKNYFVPLVGIQK